MALREGSIIYVLPEKLRNPNDFGLMIQTMRLAKYAEFCFVTSAKPMYRRVI